MKHTVFGLAALLAAGWSCHARANLLVNGGFDGGVFSSTIDGGTNDSVPLGWTPNAGYDTPGNYNSAPSGRLLLGNDPGYPLAELGQNFATAAGQLYQLTLSIADISPTGFFKVFIDGQTQLTIIGHQPAFQQPPSFIARFADGRSVLTTPASLDTFTSESFSFVGTGADTLTLAGVNDDRSYAITDLSVTGIPEPASWATLVVGCLAIGRLLRRRRARTAAPLPAVPADAVRANDV